MHRSSQVMFGALIFFGMLDLVILGFQSELSKSDWASWVQAIGTMGAIIGAVLISGGETRKREEEKRRAEYDVANAISFISVDIFTIISDFRHNRGRGDFKLYESYRRSMIRRLVTAKKMLASVPITQMIAIGVFPHALGIDRQCAELKIVMRNFTSPGDPNWSPRLDIVEKALRKEMLAVSDIIGPYYFSDWNKSVKKKKINNAKSLIRSLRQCRDTLPLKIMGVAMNKNWVRVLGGFVLGVLLTIFYFNQPKDSGEWASWVQAFGSIGAILSAVWILNYQSKEAIKRADDETLNLIKSIGDEVETLHSLFSEFSGPELMSAKGGPFLYQIPMTDAAFKIFNSCAGKIGGIKDDDLRKKIVITYAKAYGFVQSIGYNNLKVGEYFNANHEAMANGTSVSFSWAELKLTELADYGPKLRISYADLLSDATDLIKVIRETK